MTTVSLDRPDRASVAGRILGTVNQRVIPGNCVCCMGEGDKPFIAKHQSGGGAGGMKRTVSLQFYICGFCSKHVGKNESTDAYLAARGLSGVFRKGQFTAS